MFERDEDVDSEGSRSLMVRSLTKGPAVVGVVLSTIQIVLGWSIFYICYDEVGQSRYAFLLPVRSETFDPMHVLFHAALRHL